MPKLRAELSRAQSSDQDLSLARLRIDTTYAPAHASALGEVLRMIRETFPAHDLVFETAPDSCAILLPDTDIDSAVHSLDELRARISRALPEGRSLTVSVGVSSRAGRLIEEDTILEEATVSMEKAVREGGNQVIGFRADPSRFREALSSARS